MKSIDLNKLFIAIILLICAGAVGAFFGASGSYLIIFASIIGGYMAMTIGANDVANSWAPAVSSRSITLVGAIIIAFIGNAAGAILAGGEVVSTVKGGIIAQSAFSDTGIFINIMLSAIISGAIWIHFATVIGAPVSTTHSIIGAILGAGLLAGGASVVQWKVIGQIVASWIISPLLGGVIAALLLLFIKQAITYRSNKINAAKIVLPPLLGVMSFAFCLYIALKGLKNVLKLDPTILFIGSIGIGIIVFFITRPLIARGARKLSNSKDSVGSLFALPLIFGAGFLSFAHGANDVANAIGPLAAINQMLQDGIIAKKAASPFWILAIGGFGISVGLALYGAKLIKVVGKEITDLNKIRAFCVAMSAAITVLIASYLGLPVSSTHIAIGSIFGIGFLREFLKNRYQKILLEISLRTRIKPDLEAFLERFKKASVTRKKIMLKNLKKQKLDLTKKDKDALKKVYKEQLVKRNTLMKIIASWVITVPASAVLSAFVFFVIGQLGV